MAQSTNNFKFAAFQYDVEAMERTGVLDDATFVITASGIVGLHYAESYEAGEYLHTTIYKNGDVDSRESFDLKPYEWLVEVEEGTFKVMTDEEFQKFATSI